MIWLVLYPYTSKHVSRLLWMCINSLFWGNWIHPDYLVRFVWSIFSFLCIAL